MEIGIGEAASDVGDLMAQLLIDEDDILGAVRAVARYALRPHPRDEIVERGRRGLVEKAEIDALRRIAPPHVLARQLGKDIMLRQLALVLAPAPGFGAARQRRQDCIERRAAPLLAVCGRIGEPLRGGRRGKRALLGSDPFERQVNGASEDGPSGCAPRGDAKIKPSTTKLGINRFIGAT